MSLLPFEGQNQWLQLQRQLLQPAVGVLTRAQRLLLLGYDDNQRKEEELERDRWLERLAASARPEETKALKAEIRVRLTEQRTEDMVSCCSPPRVFSSCKARERQVGDDGIAFWGRDEKRHESSSECSDGCSLAWRCLAFDSKGKGVFLLSSFRHFSPDVVAL